MSKSIDNLLKQLLDSQEAQTKAFEEKFTAFAGENNTYTERMKKMEENLTEAMKKVLEMDTNIKDYHKAMGGKVEEMEAKYCAMFEPKKDEDKKDAPADEKKEDSKEEKSEEKPKPMTKEEEVKSEPEKKAEDGGEMEDEESEDEGEKEAANQLGGINKNQTVNAPMNQKRHRENPLGKPRNNASDKKLIVDGAEPSAQETTEAPQAEEVVQTPVAETTVSAPVASEAPAPSAVEVLNSKIEAALEKLASLTISKPQASTEVAVSQAVALETKAYKALEDKFEALMAKVGSLEKSASTVETKAAQIVSKQGTEAVAISVDQEVVAETDSDIYKKFEALAGVEQRKFYLANKQTIERHASSILRSKRS
jgi:hypothetical protein